MLDQKATQPATGQDAPVTTYDLVVIGAGIAGLNALFAATAYLPKNARVLLLDQKQGAGGMWNTAYDYVRLHQPHPMFTVGDIKWNWQKPRDYLAGRDEVQRHLAGALGPVADAVNLETGFEQTVIACDAGTTDNGYRARITFHPNDTPAQTTTVHAMLAIHASGLNYRMAEPLDLSASSVISIVPQDLRDILAAHPGAAVYVVGGGKTGMDTVLAALADDPKRKVSLINGRGTNFLNRTRYIPTGLKRWTSGQLVSRLFRDMALNFDGDNEEELISYFRRTYSTDPDTANGVFLYGLQSEDEQIRIAAGLSETYPGYLVDVTDGPDGPVMELQSGERLPVEPDSIFVNCTGSFFRTADMETNARCLSPGSTVLNISARDGFHFLTSVAGFFLTHLLYRKDLKGKGFYTLDHEALFRMDRNAWVGASAAQAYMNQVIAVNTLPMMLLDRCGLDLDRWYPFPRRMAGLIRMKSSADTDIAHCRKVLDRLADRFNIRCAPLD
ncbi:NAD(P)-binding protein [Sulfitobacter sp. JL08]|uniref:NAD(P)-binding protein n=1 Tax=Sulfitobacter sp. JL08 TaxID=2070369 RepID=UPI0013B3DBDF|nr:NAD(P)-binding protein [Sulfitobacter sp. JL08]